MKNLGEMSTVTGSLKYNLLKTPLYLWLNLNALFSKHPNKADLTYLTF